MHPILVVDDEADFVANYQRLLRRRGYRVVSAGSRGDGLVILEREPLALVILPHREAVGELFEARRLLEPAIAALAARRATREELAEMERIQGGLATSCGACGGGRGSL